MFQVSDYINSSIDDTERSPEDTVFEYIQAFTRWSKDCHNWIRSNKSDLTHLTCEGAKEVLDELRKKYCVSINRQYVRSSVGHYYIGGASDVHAEIDCTNEVDQNTVEVFTKPLKAKKLKGHKFVLKKKGSIWKIQSLASNSGPNKWHEESV